MSSGACRCYADGRHTAVKTTNKPPLIGAAVCPLGIQQFRRNVRHRPAVKLVRRPPLLREFSQAMLLTEPQTPPKGDWGITSRLEGEFVVGVAGEEAVEA